MPKVEINGEKLEFPTEEALNGYLSAISAPQKEPSFLSKVGDYAINSPYSPFNVMTGEMLPIAKEVMANKDKMSWGNNPATALLENVRNSALFNKYPELAGASNQVATSLTNAQPTDPELLKQYPELANVGKGYSEIRDEERARLAQYEKDYPTLSMMGSMGGMVMGGPGQVASKLGRMVPEGAGLARRLFSNAGINALLGQGMAPSDAGTGQRLMQAGGDITMSAVPDTLIGALGKFSQLREMGRGIEMGPIDAPMQPGYVPYKEGVDPRMMQARDQITAQQGVQIPLTAEQGLENPKFMQMGVKADTAMAQRQAGEQVAGRLEGNTGLASNASQLNETDIGADLGSKLAQAKQDSNAAISNKFEALKSDLAANKKETFIPTEVNNVIKEIREETARGTGITEGSITDYAKRLENEGLAGSKTKYFIKGNPAEGEQEISKEIYDILPLENKANVEVRKIPNKLSLNNLQKLRAEVTQIQGDSPALYGKLKAAIDKDIDAYAQNVSSKNPELGNRVRSVVNEWKTNNQKFENDNVNSMIKNTQDMVGQGGAPLNANPAAAGQRIFGALEKGDLNAIRSIEAVLGTDSTKEIKQRFSQRILRGDSPDQYDLQGITKRLNKYSKKNEEVLKHMLGQDYVTYRNLGYIGEKMKGAVNNYEKGNLLPDVAGAMRGSPYYSFQLINSLFGKFNNHPAIVELMLRNNKKIITPGMAGFMAKQMAMKLLQLESASQGEDPVKKVDLNE